MTLVRIQPPTVRVGSPLSLDPARTSPLISDLQTMGKRLLTRKNIKLVAELTNQNQYVKRQGALALEVATKCHPYFLTV